MTPAARRAGRSHTVAGIRRMILGWMPPGSMTITKGYNMAQTITEEQKQLLLQTTLQGGMNAWEYIQSQNEANRPWVAAGILRKRPTVHG